MNLCVSNAKNVRRALAKQTKEKKNASTFWKRLQKFRWFGRLQFSLLPLGIFAMSSLDGIAFESERKSRTIFGPDFHHAKQTMMRLLAKRNKTVQYLNIFPQMFERHTFCNVTFMPPRIVIERHTKKHPHDYVWYEIWKTSSQQRQKNRMTRWPIASYPSAFFANCWNFGVEKRNENNKMAKM